MAIGDIKYLNGKPVRILSSGETPTVYWKDGRPVIVHEYIEESGEETSISIIMHHFRNINVI
jgi:hypothetical protein